MLLYSEGWDLVCAGGSYKILDEYRWGFSEQRQAAASGKCPPVCAHPRKPVCKMAGSGERHPGPCTEVTSRPHSGTTWGLWLSWETHFFPLRPALLLPCLPQKELLAREVTAPSLLEDFWDTSHSDLSGLAEPDLEQHKGTSWPVKGPSNPVLSSHKYGGGQNLRKKNVQLTF